MRRMRIRFAIYRLTIISSLKRWPVWNDLASQRSRWCFVIIAVLFPLPIGQYKNESRVRVSRDVRSHVNRAIVKQRIIDTFFSRGNGRPGGRILRGSEAPDHAERR